MSLLRRERGSNREGVDRYLGMGFVPLTFGMELEDGDFESGLNKTLKTLRGINSIIEESGKIATNAMKPIKGLGKAMLMPFKGLGSALSVANQRINSFNLADIASNMKALSGQTGNLSDEIDSAFASSAKAVKPMLASIGKSGKELRKLTGQAAGMAYSMNVGADAVGKVMVELESAGGPAKKALDALNMSTKDFVKLTEVSGIEIKDLSANLGDLQASWNMSTEESVDTTEAMLAYGQAVGVGSQGLMQFKPLMDKMNSALADAPESMKLSSKEMKQLAISSVKLAGAYRQMGASQEQSMELSQQTAELFVKEASSYQKAITEGGEYGDMSQKLMTIMAGWGVTWDQFGGILREGAVDSTKGMMRLQEVVQSASSKGFGPADILMRRLLGTLSETSPSMAWLAQNVTVGKDALAKFDAMTVNSTGSLKKFAKEGFTTGFTLQEQFDMGRKSMEHMVRSISGKEVTGYVRTQVKAYKEMGKTVKGLAGDETWGPLVKTASILKRAGLQGMLMSMTPDKRDQMEMGKTFAGLELAAGTVDDISESMGPIMQAFGKFGPLGTMAGGLATWFTISKAARDEIVAQVSPVFERLKEEAKKIWYGDDDGTGLKKHLVTMVGGAVDEMKPAIKSLIGDIATYVGEGISDALQQNIWGPVTRFFDGIPKAAGYVVDYIGDVFERGFMRLEYAFVSLTSSMAAGVLNLPGIGKLMGVAGIDVEESKRALLKAKETLRDEILKHEKDSDIDLVGRFAGFKTYASEGASGAKKIIGSGNKMGDTGLSEMALDTGKGMMSGFSQGIDEGQSEAINSLDLFLNEVKQNVEFNSPPVKGPLSGSDTDNPVYNGGFGMMELFGQGILDGSFLMQTALEEALLMSFDAAWGVYEGYATEKIGTSTVMAQVADQLVRQLGGTAKLDLTAQEKKIIKTNVDVPGMAGVTATIVADGALTRKVLNRIADATEGMHSLMKPGGKGATMVLAQ